MSLPIFVITLKGARARRQPLLARLDEFGLSYKLWFGVDGRNGLPSEMEPLVDRTAARKTIHREMTDGEFACALSHHSVYREILDQNLIGAIVLEDDAIIGTRFKEYISAAQKQLYDLLLLDHKRVFAATQKPKRIIDCTQAFRVTLPPYLATGYAVSNNGARAFIKHGFPIRALADWPFDISRLDTWAALPRLVDHGSLEICPSDIRQARDSAQREGKKLNRSIRFFRPVYWRRVWKKQISARIS